MTPRHDPLQVFKTRTTPTGLYARQKWRNESMMNIDSGRRMLMICLTSDCIPAKCNIVAGQPAASKPAGQMGRHTKKHAQLVNRSLSHG